MVPLISRHTSVDIPNKGWLVSWVNWQQNKCVNYHCIFTLGSLSKAFMILRLKFINWYLYSNVMNHIYSNANIFLYIYYKQLKHSLNTKTCEKFTPYYYCVRLSFIHQKCSNVNWSQFDVVLQCKNSFPRLIRHFVR